MTTLIERNLEGLLIIYDLYSEYITRLNVLLSNPNTHFIVLIKTSLDILDTSRSKLTKLLPLLESLDTNVLTFEKYIKLIFTSYSLIYKLKLHTYCIYQILSKELHSSIEYDLSTTSAIETSDRLEKISRAYNNYKKIDEDTHKHIVSFMSRKLFRKSIKEIPNAPYVLVQKYYHKDSNTVHLYAKFMEKILNHHYSQKLPNKHLIEKQLDQDKTWQLTQYNIEEWYKHRFTTATKRHVKNNVLISQWNLIPVSMSLSLKDVFDKLFRSTTGGHDCDIYGGSNIQAMIDKVSRIKKMDINLIIIKKIFADAINTDITKIIGEFARDYIILEKSGVTKKAVDKFDIFKFTQAGKYAFDIKKYSTQKKKRVDVKGDDKEIMYFIIETLDNKTYKILAPYKGKEYAVPERNIPKLLTYISNKNKIDISRITEYNKTLEVNMYKNLLFSSKVDLTNIASESAYKIDIGPIRQNILIALTNICDTLIKKNKPENLSDLRSILINPLLVDKLTEIQIELYKSEDKYFKLDINKDKNFDMGHILDTVLYELNSNANSFKKRLIDNFESVITEVDMAVNLTKSSGRLLRYKTVIEQSIKITLESFITREFNVYQNIIFKIDMMNAL